MPRPVGVASQSPPQAHAPHHHPLLDERPPGCQLFATATARSFFLGAVGFLPSRGRPGLRVAEAWACADSLYPRLVPLRARPCPPRGSRF